MKNIYLLAICLLMFSMPFSINITNEGIIFEYDAENAQNVFLVGSMNDWNTDATPMKKEDDGVWRIFIKLDYGEYAYKFMVDGVWQYDQNNPDYEDDGYGGFNSIIRYNDTIESYIDINDNFKGVKSSFNPKIYFKGHYFSTNRFIKNDISRFMLSKPEHDLNFGINIKFNPDFEAYTILNVNNVKEDTEMWKTHFNYKRSYLKLNVQYAHLIAFDNFGLVEFDNPLNIIGNIGYKKYKFGYNYSGIYVDSSDLLSRSISSVIPLSINTEFVLSDKIGYDEDDILASRIKVTPQFFGLTNFSFGGSQFKYTTKLSEELTQIHDNYSFDFKYTKKISRMDWKDAMQFKIIAEQSRYNNINITSSEDVWMKGENRLLGLSLEFPIALKIYSNYLYSVFDINENQSRHRFDLGFNYSYNKCTWNFESSLWKNNLSENLTWSDYYKYFEKYDGNGRWFQEFSELSFERYTILGYDSGVLHTSDIKFSFNVKNKSINFNLKNKFSQYDLFTLPKYIENIIVFEYYLSDLWVFKTDTRIPYYNDPFLNLHTNFSEDSNVFISNYTEIAYHITKQAWISFGFGVNPKSMDLITDQFHSRGREEYLESSSNLSEHLDSFYGGFGEKILNAEKLLMNEKQISIQAIIKF